MLYDRNNTIIVLLLVVSTCGLAQTLQVTEIIMFTTTKPKENRLYIPQVYML